MPTSPARASCDSPNGRQRTLRALRRELRWLRRFERHVWTVAIEGLKRWARREGLSLGEATASAAAGRDQLEALLRRDSIPCLSAALKPANAALKPACITLQPANATSSEDADSAPSTPRREPERQTATEGFNAPWPESPTFTMAYVDRLDRPDQQRSTDGAPTDPRRGAFMELVHRLRSGALANQATPVDQPAAARGRDRRRTDRVPVLSPVRYRTMEEDVSEVGWVTNVSVGGVFIRAPKAPPPETLLAFGFYVVHKGERHLIRSMGQVAWIAGSEGFGVRFLKPPDPAVDALGEIVQDYLHVEVPWRDAIPPSN